MGYIGNRSDIETEDVGTVTRNRIADESEATTIQSIESVDRSECGADYRLELTVEGGFYAGFNRDSRYRIKSIVGGGSSDTVTLWVIERNY